MKILFFLFFLILINCIDELDHKYAYVTIHYEGTKNDAEYVLGIEVMVKSLLLSGTSIIKFFKN